MNINQYIDWASAESHFFINKKNPAAERAQRNFISLPKIPYHIWLASSGTNSTFTLYALSKTSFLASAESVNNFLGLNQKDIWLNVLPIFHVGGLSIFARAYLSRAKIFDRSKDAWSAEKFHIWCAEHKPTITSLVPTQLHDLVQLKKKCPQYLQRILVGGAALDADLYFQARDLGYAVLPSYGMTECCSQIATASPYLLKNSTQENRKIPELMKLPHVEVRLTSDSRLMVKSNSLFTIQANWLETLGSWDILYRAGDWYTTQDRVELQKIDELRTVITPVGRVSQQKKIMGEWVDLQLLHKSFQETLAKKNRTIDFQILTQKNERRGESVIICLPASVYDEADVWIKEFNQQVIPVARIQAAYFVKEFPKTELGKTSIRQLNQILFGSEK